MTLVITPPIVSSPATGRDVEQQQSLTSPSMIAAGPPMADDAGSTCQVGWPCHGQAANQGLHRRDPRRAADEDDLVDVVGGDLGVLHGLLDRAEAALDEVGGELARTSTSSG